MKVFVVKECIDSDKNYLAKKTIIEDFDEEKESKLLALGLVEEYEESKHLKLVSNLKSFNESGLIAKDEEIASLNEKLIAKDEEIADLVSIVEETSQLAKGQVPDRFLKYKGE